MASVIRQNVLICDFAGTDRDGRDLACFFIAKAPQARALVRERVTMQCDYERVSADDTPSEPWLAIGLDLTLVPTAEGGRSVPVFLDKPGGYRPNWGLPGMTGIDQTGAPILCSSASPLAPGHGARAVIIPLHDASMVEWRLLDHGDRLRMFEGHRVVGHATVRWVENTSIPVPGTDEARFRAWANSTDDRPAPA